MNEYQSAPEMIGESPVFLEALSRASATAPLNRPVLVAGERGTGKELFAGRLHFLSSRWEGPFIKVNCAALSEALLESELFGHEAGAFTGATKRHLGRFERAEGGTLFLDEISSASMRIQEKLLRVIEYGEYERLGGDKTQTADVRIVGAANIDLRHQAAEGKFRADLLDRLTFEVITAPPLRARQEDIPILASYFATKFTSELTLEGSNGLFEGFTPGAMEMMKQHSWPGNVRELRNCVERSVYRWVSSETSGPVGEIIIDPFDNEYSPLATLNATSKKEEEPAHSLVRTPQPAPFQPSALQPLASGSSYDLRNHLNETEKNLVLRALHHNSWQQTRTAKFLHLTYDQMRGLIRKHDLNEEKGD